MILVKGAKGTVLHTGDFRFRPEMLDFFRDVEIESLFLDNTFACPSEDFPT
jgi:mRNA degradation ribonuclease J1/J2